MNKRIAFLFAMSMMVVSACSNRPAYEPTPPDQYARYATPPATPVVSETTAPVVATEPVKPVVEIYKGQAALCAKASPHSTAWDMESCDDLERVRRGQKPANDFDDWFAHQNVSGLDAWLDNQSTVKSFSKSLLPVGHATVMANLKSPSSARFINEAVVMRCPDNDTFIAVYGFDAQNSFGATQRSVLCVGVSASLKTGALVDCGPLNLIRFNLEQNKKDSLPTNVRLACELPAQLLHVK